MQLTAEQKTIGRDNYYEAVGAMDQHLPSRRDFLKTAIGAGLVSGAGLDRPYTGGEFTVADKGTVAFTSGNGQRPSDVSVSRRGKVTQLTNLNESFLGAKTLGEVKPLSVKSSFDQRPVD